MTEERIEEIRRYMLEEGPRSIEGDWATELWQEVDNLRQLVEELWGVAPDISRCLQENMRLRLRVKELEREMAAQREYEFDRGWKAAMGVMLDKGP